MKLHIIMKKSSKTLKIWIMLKELKLENLKIVLRT